MHARDGLSCCGVDRNEAQILLVNLLSDDEKVAHAQQFALGFYGFVACRNLDKVNTYGHTLEVYRVGMLFPVGLTEVSARNGLHGNRLNVAPQLCIIFLA